MFLKGSQKFCSLQNLSRFMALLRRAGKQIVFTNGCFDILHAGHVQYLERARNLGDFLVVGLNSDRSVRKLKGKGRPVNSQNDRALVLAGLTAVDCVTIFDEETPLNLIQKVRPHILVKGADWSINSIAGAQEVKSWGGKVKLIPLLKGRSSSGILKKIKSKKT